MRGKTTRQATFTAITPDQKVPKNHPIRRIRALVEPILKGLSPVFEEMYAEIGRPSIPPEHLLKATLLMTLYSVRSERQFCERLEYDLLFKWFLDLNLEDRAFDPSTFSKNRERLLEHDVAGKFMQAVLDAAQRRHLLSEEHFTVDGTLLEAWASLNRHATHASSGWRFRVLAPVSDSVRRSNREWNQLPTKAKSRCDARSAACHRISPSPLTWRVESAPVDSGDRIAHPTESDTEASRQ